MHTCMMAERKRYLKDKKRNVMNWINGFDAGNKKEKYSLTCRLGTFTVLEIKIESNKFRFMIFNLGFEI